MSKPIILGAVLYDPKVSVIWDIIRDYFEDSGVPMDVVFFTNYEMQVDSLVNGHVEVAWNFSTVARNASASKRSIMTMSAPSSSAPSQ